MIRKPRIDRRGYWAVRIEGKYILEHRYVMQQHLGRNLTSQEAVHHINHDTRDNRIENLLLCKTHGEHTKLHHPEIAERHRILYKGKRFSTGTEFKKGMIPWNKGTIGVMISWNKGKTGYHHKNPRPKMTLKEKKIFVGNNSGCFKKGFTPWNAGTAASEEVISARRRSTLERYKERHKLCSRTIHRCGQ